MEARQEAYGHVSSSQELPSIEVEPAPAGTPSNAELHRNAASLQKPSMRVDLQMPIGTSGAAERLSQGATAIGSGDGAQAHPPKSVRPTAERWKDFLGQNDKVMASRIELGDMRTAFSSKAALAVEQALQMQNRMRAQRMSILDPASAEGMDGAVNYFMETLQDLITASEEFWNAEKQLVQSEWAINQTVPQVLAEHADSTLEFLQQNELDFKVEDTLDVETISERTGLSRANEALDADNHITGLQREINRLEDRVLELEERHLIQATISAATSSEVEPGTTAPDYEAEQTQLTAELRTLRSQMERLRGGDGSSNLGFLSSSTVYSKGQRPRVPSGVEETLPVPDESQRPVSPVRIHTFLHAAESKATHVNEWLRKQDQRSKPEATRFRSRLPVPVRQIPNQRVKSMILDAWHMDKPTLSAPSSMVVEDTIQTRSIPLLSDDQGSVLARSDPLLKPLTRLRRELSDEQQELAEIEMDRTPSYPIFKRRSA